MTKDYTKRLLKAIPGEACKYPRGFDQYPSNASQILTKCKGTYVFYKNYSKIITKYRSMFPFLTNIVKSDVSRLKVLKYE